jgi:hypothetical protein
MARDDDDANAAAPAIIIACRRVNIGLHRSKLDLCARRAFAPGARQEVGRACYQPAPPGASMTTTPFVTGRPVQTTAATGGATPLSSALKPLGDIFDQRHTRMAQLSQSNPKLASEYTIKPMEESASFSDLLGRYPGLKKLLDRNAHAIFSGQPDAGKQLFPVAWEGWGHSVVADKERRNEVVFVLAKTGGPSLRSIEIPMSDGSVQKLPPGYQIVYAGREGDHQRTFEKGGGSQYFQSFDLQAKPGEKVQMAYLRWHPGQNGEIDGWKAGLPDFELGGGERHWPRDLTGAYPGGRNAVFTARSTASPTVIRCPD